jgi:hypothetical protein
MSVPIAERLAAEAPLALGAVLWRAHDRARSLEQLLELEATDPRVAGIHHAAKALRKAIAAALVEVAATRVDRDCPGCLLSPATCDAIAAAGGGRCCGECPHG